MNTKEMSDRELAALWNLMNHRDLRPENERTERFLDEVDREMRTRWIPHRRGEQTTLLGKTGRRDGFAVVGSRPCDRAIEGA